MRFTYLAALLVARSLATPAIAHRPDSRRHSDRKRNRRYRLRGRDAARHLFSGVGAPFLLAAAFSDRLTRRLRSIGRIGRRLHQPACLVTIAMGIAMMTGQLSVLSYWLLEQFPIFTRIG